MAMTIPELKLDNGFTIPNVTINDPAAFLKAIKTAKPTSSICPQLRNTLRGGDADNLGDALLARYGSNRLGHSMSRVTGIFPSLEYVRDARASWIKHVIETLIEKNNLLLCRRPAFSNALRGTQLYFGSSADAMSEVEYLCNAPKHQGYHIVLHEGEPATVRGEDLPDLLAQLLQGEGLGQEVEIGGVDDVAAGHFFRVPGNDDDLDLRPLHPDQARQLPNYQSGSWQSIQSSPEPQTNDLPGCRRSLESAARANQRSALAVRPQS